MTDPIKLQPFIHRGMVLMYSGGVDFEVAPVQLFVSDGRPVLRIGRNAIFFHSDGRVQGSECKTASHLEPEVEARVLGDLQAAFKVQRQNYGRSPSSTFFPEGSNGWRHETADWPDPQQQPPRKSVIEAAPKSNQPQMLFLGKDPASIINGFGAIAKQLIATGVPGETVVHALQQLAASGTAAQLPVTREQFVDRMGELYDLAEQAVAAGAPVVH